MVVTTWPVFELPLLGREVVADRTMTFRWQKPVFHANRWPTDAAFARELQDLAVEVAGPQYVASIGAASMGWDGETGHIDAALLERYGSDPFTPTYYLAGPPSTVGSLRSMLLATGVDEDDLRGEEFTGCRRTI